MAGICRCDELSADIAAARTRKAHFWRLLQTINRRKNRPYIARQRLTAVMFEALTQLRNRFTAHARAVVSNPWQRSIEALYQGIGSTRWWSWFIAAPGICM